jgi:hypothetical protein
MQVTGGYLPLPATHEAYVHFGKLGLLLKIAVCIHGASILVDDVHVLIVMAFIGPVNAPLVLPRGRVVLQVGLHYLLSGWLGGVMHGKFSVKRRL